MCFSDPSDRFSLVRSSKTTPHASNHAERSFEELCYEIVITALLLEASVVVGLRALTRRDSIIAGAAAGALVDGEKRVASVFVITLVTAWRVLLGDAVF